MGIEVFLLDRDFHINTNKYNNIYDLPYVNNAKLLRQNQTHEFGELKGPAGKLGDVIYSECIRSLTNYERIKKNHMKEEEKMWIAIVCFDNFMFSRMEGSYYYSYLIQNMIMHFAVLNEIIHIHIRNDNNKLKSYLQHEAGWNAIQDVINKLDNNYITIEIH